MVTEVIKKHNFQKTLKRLKAFSERKQDEIEIESVATHDGIIGFFLDLDHKVTGREFNSRIENIQEIFIELNKKNIEIVKEFNNIYKTFDYLDKEYISAILSVLKGVEKTSDDVKIQQAELKKHHTALEQQQNKLNSHQGEIDNIISNMEITIKVLQKFKSQLDNLKHLNEIDTIWKDCKDIQTKIELVSENFDTVNEASLMKINTLENQLDVLSQKNDNDMVRVETIEQDIAVLKKDIISRDTKIGKEIDEIQSLLAEHQTKIELVSENFDTVNEASLMKINTLENQLDVLSQKNDNDMVRVETIEQDIAVLKKDIISRDTKIGKGIDEIQSLLAEHDVYQSKLKTQIQRGYIVSGGALVIAISAIVLNLTW